jgi:riboflavin biosynthesis pyrimidine reductase
LTVRVRQLLPTPADDIDLVAAYAYPDSVRERPWLRGNMIASADGAATLEGRAGGLGNPTDQRVLGLLRALSDVVIAGSGTVITEGYGPARVRQEYQAARAAAGQPPAPVMAVVSNQLRLDFSSRYFTNEKQRPIVVTCETAPQDRLREARKVADVVLAGAKVVEPPLMVEALAERGYHRLLCEGGPTLLGDVAASGALDELCLTISPLLVGGPSRRILDGPVMEPPSRLRLTHLLLDDDELLYARYEVRR